MQSEGRPYPVYLSLLRHPRPASSPCLEQCGEDCCAVQVRSYEFLPDAGPSKQCRRVVPRRVEMHGYSFVCGEGDRAAAASDGDAHGGAVKILEKNLQRQPDGSHRTIEAGVARLMANGYSKRDPRQGLAIANTVQSLYGHGTVTARSRHSGCSVTAHTCCSKGSHIQPGPSRSAVLALLRLSAHCRSSDAGIRPSPPLLGCT